MPTSGTRIEVTANGLTFAALAEGPADGPLALCLHDFPDSAHTWRYLLPDLAAAGLRAVAPWMRGYAPTSVPADGSYGAGALAADACALHDVLGGDERAVLIGHDWGALAAYGAASFAPERWSRLVTGAVPRRRTPCEIRQTSRPRSATTVRCSERPHLIRRIPLKPPLG